MRSDCLNFLDTHASKTTNVFLRVTDVAYRDATAGLQVILLFGRITYELMASYWPTPNAIRNYTC